MSEIELKSGYYNATLVETTNEDGEKIYEPDRVYNAEDLNDFLEGLVSSNGIYYDIATRCQVVVGDGGLNVIVNEGKGIVNNHWFKITENTKLELSAADVVMPRKDRVIIRYSKENRNCVLTILEGDPASEPVAPTLTRDVNGIYEISLATITIGKNAKTIITTNIKDERADSSVCGWITGLVQQLDTSEIYNQYETACEAKLNELDANIDERVELADARMENANEEFMNWFSGVQESVKATSLYREYEAIYKTTVSYQQSIQIPSSINYVHNGLDVLNVILYGTTHLIKDVDYTISTDGKYISLTEAIAESGSTVLLVNKKSIDGQAAESVTVQVEALQQQVNGLTLSDNFVYNATGTDDNIAISNIVKNFLDGIGDYSSVKDNASMSLYIHGEIKITNLIDNQMAFDFHNTVESNRKVFIDFGNATITYSVDTPPATLVMFGSNNGNVIISKANIYLADIYSGGYPYTTYIFHGGIIRDCKIECLISAGNSIYGVYNAEEVSNSEIKIKGVAIYVCNRVQFNNIKAFTAKFQGGDTTTLGGYAVYMYGSSFFIGNQCKSQKNNSVGSSVIDLGNAIEVSSSLEW